MSYGQAAPYCLPTYTSGSGFGDFINSVQLGTINNVNSGATPSPYYTNYTSNWCAQMNPGSTYSLTVQCGWFGTNNNIYAWIDYNHDNVFQHPGELIGQATLMTGNQTSTITFTIPLTALSGFTRLRVREIYGSAAVADPCANKGFGETEDYCVGIISPYSKDIGTSNLISPTSDCGLSSSTIVTANFFNSGTDTIFNFSASYNVNNGFSTATEVINDTIFPQSAYAYTFTTLADFSTPGPNNVSIWASLNPSDSNSLNDTIHRVINNYLLINSFPFIENFESGSLSIAARTSNGIAAQSFVTPMAAKNSANGFLMTGTNGGGFTTPALGSEWTINQSSSSKLEYCIDATDTANLHCGLILKFDLKQTATFDEMYSSFRVLVNGIQVSTTYHPSAGNNGVNADPFKRYVINLQSYVGTLFNLTFESRNKYDSLSAMPGDNAFIDNIRIGPNPPNDITTLRIIEPFDACSLNRSPTLNDSIKVEFKNTGCNSILSGTVLPLGFTLNGNVISENYILPNTLAFNDSFIYTFQSTFPFNTPGVYTLKAYPNWISDGDNSNDTIVGDFLTQPNINTYPYTEGFDSIVYWTTQPVVGINNWTINTGGMIGSPWLSAHSGSHFAEFSRDYAAGNRADLTGPCFDFSSLTHPSLKFWIGQYAFATNYAAIFPMVSIDGGATYNQVDSISVQDNVASPALWRQFQVCLDAYAHQPDVKIKFRSRGNYSQNIGLDDILIEDIADTNAVAVIDDTICSGVKITALISNTKSNVKYYIVNQNNVRLSNNATGNGGLLSITTSNVVNSSFILKIAFSDSLPASFCQFYMKDTVPIIVYQQTAANAGADTSICLGSVANFHAIGGMSYQWSPTIGLSNPYIANPTVTVTSTTTYTVVANTPANCPTSDVIIISVTPKPSAFAGIDKTICTANQNVTIGGSPTATGGSLVYSYQWTPALGITSATNIANPTVSPTATIAYILTVTDNNQCSDNDTVLVKYNTPISHFLSSTNVTCNGNNNGTASISVIGGTSPVVTWGTTPNIVGVNSINGLAPNTYIVYINDALGCSILDTLVITQPLPISLSLNATTTTCGNCNGTIASTIVGGVSPFIYNWSNGSHNDSIVNGCNGNYILTIQDQSGCTKVDSAKITGPGGASAFKISAGKDEQVCDGYSVYIGGVPTLTGGTLPYTYNWTPSSFLSSSTIPNPFVSQPTTSTTYYLTASDGYGCILKDTVSVIVNSLPTANAGSDITYCKLANANIGAPSTPGLSYIWTPSAGLNNDNIANPTVNITATQTYTIRATNTFGCFTTDQVVVTVNYEPIINAGSDLFYFGQNPAALAASGATNYVWSPPFGLNATFGSNVQASPANTTTYTVTGIDINGCSSTDDVVVYVLSTGIDEISTKIDLKIYPNPFESNTTVDFNLQKSQNVKVLLFSVSGQLINTIVDEALSEGNHKLNIDATTLTTGQYLLLIKNNEGIVVKKIVKQ
ncbi:MAG: hypothetical protein RL065_273 [Bacteroidota bacterium]